MESMRKRAPGGGRKPKSEAEKAVRAPDVWLKPTELEQTLIRFGNTTEAVKAALTQPAKDAPADDWIAYFVQEFGGTLQPDGSVLIPAQKKA